MRAFEGMKTKPKLKRYVRVKWTNFPERVVTFLLHSDSPTKGFTNAPRSLYEITPQGAKVEGVEFHLIPKTWEVKLKK